MPTPAGRRLTEAHRLAQARLGVTVVRQIRAAWRLLDPSDLDRTTGAWLRVAIPIVQQHHAVSSELAADYVRAFRTLELGERDGFAPQLSRGPNLRAVTTSLLVTGPFSIKTARKRGVPVERAMTNAFTRSAGEAMRHSLSGGRLTLLESVRADDRARGWARVTGGKACEFCRMLAGRGAVYGSGADFQAHAHCSCSAEPVYQ